MRYPPVHWYEGLFLQPHHFQAADRYLTELMQSSLEFDHPYYYGIRSLEFAPRRWPTTSLRCAASCAGCATVQSSTLARARSSIGWT